jgi:endonuclease YncB( thermonuclease family)
MSEFPLLSASRRPVALALAAAVGLAAPLIPASLSASPVVSGRATVVDGDTLEVDGERIRLEGIDAPEHAQTCGRRWIGTWKCGLAAADALARLTAGRRVDCASAGRDKYGRMLGWCSIDGRDLNALLVREGLAWAFVKYSEKYKGVEAEARLAKVGIWQGEAEPAWEYRAKKWTVAEQVAPQGCAIKGNITEHGHIYHMPWSPWYGKVKVDPAKGEQWFCTEAEAAQAGFRPAMSH